jgi:hypothetical protein
MPFVHDHFLNLLDPYTEGLDRRVKDGRRRGESELTPGSGGFL